MLGPETRSAVARLAAAVLSVKPLVEGVGVPVRVVPVGRAAVTSPGDRDPGRWRALRKLLDRVARVTGVTGLVLSEEAPHELRLFERVVSERLALGDVLDAAAVVPVDRLGEVDRVVRDAVADSFDAYCRREEVVSPDGVPLETRAAGSGRDTVVLVPAVGMPTALVENWVRFFSRHRRVLTWETRGLFGAAAYGGEPAVDVEAQAADLVTVLDHHGVADAHVIGLCGGAVIALVAAARQPARIRSLSLWHGAYGFARNGPRTSHEWGMTELMTVAAGSRSAARGVHAAFCEAVLTGTAADVAHLVLYPYASAELLYRYCRLNLATGVPVEPYLAEVRLPALVVTSRDDHVAHPESSRRVAAGLANGELRVEPHGDHLALFSAHESLLEVAEEFIRRHEEAGGGAHPEPVERAHAG